MKRPSILLFFVLMLFSVTQQLKTAPMVRGTQWGLRVHEGGLQVATPLAGCLNTARMLGLVAVCVRSISTLLETQLVDNNSSLAHACRAGIAFTRLAEECFYIAYHPHDDHTFDVCWALADAAQIGKSLFAAAIAGPSTDWSELPIGGEIVALGLLEAAAAGYSQWNADFAQDSAAGRKVRFIARAFASAARLVAAAHQERELEKQQVYAGLFVAQLLYVATKLVGADFNLSAAEKAAQELSVAPGVDSQVAYEAYLKKLREQYASYCAGLREHYGKNQQRPPVDGMPKPAPKRYNMDGARLRTLRHAIDVFQQRPAAAKQKD